MDTQDKQEMAEFERKLEITAILNEYSDEFVRQMIEDAKLLQIELLIEQANQVLEGRKKAR